LLWTSLLMWGSVNAIVGRPDWTLSNKDVTPDVQAARELVFHLHLPSASEYNRAHLAIVEAVESRPRAYWRRPLEAPLIPPDKDRERDCFVADGKMSPETARFLCDEGHARREGSGYRVVRPLGLLVGLALADACSSSSGSCITDQSAAYTSLTRWYRARASGYPSGIDLDDPHLDDYQRAVTVSIQAIGATGIDNGKLLALRRRELEGNEPHAVHWRQEYLASIQECAIKLFAAASDDERQAIEDDYSTKIQEHWRNLSELLRQADAAYHMQRVSVAVAVVTTAVGIVGAISGHQNAELVGLGGAAVGEVMALRIAKQAKIDLHAQALQSSPVAMLLKTAVNPRF